MYILLWCVCVRIRIEGLEIIQAKSNWDECYRNQQMWSINDGYFPIYNNGGYQSLLRVV